MFILRSGLESLRRKTIRKIDRSIDRSGFYTAPPPPPRLYSVFKFSVFRSIHVAERHTECQYFRSLESRCGWEIVGNNTTISPSPRASRFHACRALDTRTRGKEKQSPGTHLLYNTFMSALPLYNNVGGLFCRGHITIQAGCEGEKN